MPVCGTVVQGRVRYHHWYAAELGLSTFNLRPSTVYMGYIGFSYDIYLTSLDINTSSK